MKPQNFSQTIKRSICPTETCYVLNDSSHLDKSDGRKHVCIWRIFRLRIATRYDKVAFSENCLLCPG